MDYGEQSKKLRKLIKDIRGMKKEIITFIETRGAVTGSYFNKKKLDKLKKND
tara:strand:+ start:814 stop:969 length:156 start_codon:yes stop_codon:yes gene_type:complete